MLKKLNSDTIIAMILLLICGVMFHNTFSFREMPLAIVKSNVWPRIVLVFFFIFSLAYLVQSLKAKTDTGSKIKIGGIKGWITANRNIIWCFSLFTLFLLSLPYLGMLIGGGIFVFASLTCMGRNEIRSHLINLIIAVVSMGIMWALFTFGLNVMLPQGSIFVAF
jgi:putative tricarboxylic transport membrane protein